jgi:hypothetical protein
MSEEDEQSQEVPAEQATIDKPTQLDRIEKLLMEIHEAVVAKQGEHSLGHD